VSIWAIADIHASPLDPITGAPSKPMSVFGEHWRDHVDRIENSWNALVRSEDTVIVAGDIDWAMRLDEALPTLRRIGGWNGRKILLRGNHDFWWSSDATTKVRRVLPPNMDLLHNNAITVEGYNVIGVKGSPVPGAIEWTETDAKLLHRETERLKLSIADRDPSLPTIAAFHYPPFFPAQGSTPFVDILQSAGVELCVYGHVHGSQARFGPNGAFDGIEYIPVAADFLDFAPKPLVREGVVVPSG
jgi:predicted phosphohydrolase